MPGAAAGQEESSGLTCRYTPCSQTDRFPSVPLPSALALPTPLSAPSQLLLEPEGTGMNTPALSLKCLEKTAMWGREGGGVIG